MGLKLTPVGPGASQRELANSRRPRRQPTGLKLTPVGLDANRRGLLLYGRRWTTRAAHSPLSLSLSRQTDSVTSPIVDRRPSPTTGLQRPLRRPPLPPLTRHPPPAASNATAPERRPARPQRHVPERPQSRRLVALPGPPPTPPLPNPSRRAAAAPNRLPERRRRPAPLRYKNF
jgi:hypothetical protein